MPRALAAWGDLRFYLCYLHLHISHLSSALSLSTKTFESLPKVHNFEFSNLLRDTDGLFVPLVRAQGVQDTTLCYLPVS